MGIWRQRRNQRRGLEEGRALWAFQVLLLILIFFTWFVWDRLFPIFTLTTSHCVEQAVSFGGRDGLLHIYTLLVYMVGLLALLWVTIAFTFRHGFRHWLTYAVHLTSLISLLFLFFDFRAMRVDERTTPDGTLAVQPIIMDNSVSPPQFFPTEYRGSDGGHWEFIKSRNKTLGWDGYRSPECVWLDRNLISQDPLHIVPGYASLSKSEKYELSRTVYSYEADGYGIAFSKALIMSIKSAFGDTSMMERLQFRQAYRPLSEEERSRFLKKQDCLKKEIYTSGHNQKCQYVWIPEWENFE